MKFNLNGVAKATLRSEAIGLTYLAVFKLSYQ